MALLRQSRDYVLQHVDPDSGVGLLYADCSRNYIFLNPVAAFIWSACQDWADLLSSASPLPDPSAIHGGRDFVMRTISGMLEAGVLTSSDCPPVRDSGVIKETATGLVVPPLRQIYIYATRYCTARCYHCYIPLRKVPSDGVVPKSEHVGVATLLRLTEAALPLGLRYVKVTGGEPLLLPDAPILITGLRSLGVEVSVETNGFLLTERLASLLAANNIDVMVSLDGASPATHDVLRRQHGSFEHALAALRLLVSHGLRPHVTMTVSHRNLDEIEAVGELAKSVGADQLKLNPVITTGEASRLRDRPVVLTLGDIIRLHERHPDLEASIGLPIYIEGPPAFSSYDRLMSGRGGAICDFLSLLGVLPDGSLSFCGLGFGHPELVFANICDESFDLERVWRGSEVLAYVRAAMTVRAGRVCRQCVLERTCNSGCPAFTYGEYGSFRQPSPWCQQAYDQGIFPKRYLKPSYSVSEGCGVSGSAAASSRYPLTGSSRAEHRTEEEMRG